MVTPKPSSEKLAHPPLSAHYLSSLEPCMDPEKYATASTGSADWSEGFLKKEYVT